jgi:hypothetical protein
LRAQAYAYHFFFRRMIPMPGLRRASMQGAPYEIAPQRLDAFLPGMHASLDCVCRGVLEGTHFIFENRMHQSDQIVRQHSVPES